MTRTATQERSGGHRERLLFGAIECVKAKGYARTTARDIVEASGTNLASIGYHFGSKEALINEALRENAGAWTAQVNAAVAAAREDGAPPLQQLLTSWKTMLDTVAEQRPFVVALLEAIARAEHSPELRQQLAAQYQEVRRSVAREIGQALGPAVDPRTVEILASFAIAVCDGLAAQWLVDAEHVPSGDELATAFMNGILLSLQPENR